MARGVLVEAASPASDTEYSKEKGKEMKIITKLASAIALVGMMSFGHAAEIFTLQEGAIDGTPDNEVTANRMTLRYEAFVDQQADGSFTETGIFDVTGYSLDNSSVSTFLNAPEIAGGYQLYGAFQLSGDIAFVGTTALATFDTGLIILLADPLSDSDIQLVGGVPTCVSGCADDVELAFSDSLIAPSQANIPLVGDQAASGGSYIVNFDDLLLSAIGEAYFSDPSPFYLQLEVTGENESFDPPLVAGDYQGILQGDASVVFVPEPGTLGLLGLALMGLGFLGFRRTA